MTAPVLPAAWACDLVWVEGPGAEAFLNGLLTNDVAALADGDDQRTLLLDASGHIRSDMRLARTASGEYTLVTPAGQGADLASALERYHFSEDLVVLGPEEEAARTVPGGADARPATDGLAVRGLVPGTWDLVGGTADAPGLDQNERDRMRIEAGAGLFGRDFGTANLVQEAGLEHAVAFDKGCYLGQETVARVHYRGHVNRRLRGLLLPEPTPAGGEVTSGGRAVGTLTSAVLSPHYGPIGLALLRREVEDGAAVSVAGAQGTATVVPLPFADGA